ncbi:MAG: BlaI/MecI/CopY family transcriptional regulator [Ruminococcaceae bacterium]|nr:BlaI/MecI/CopY family transcriptional regulator [Oscillospiraceae bacterium]
MLQRNTNISEAELEVMKVIWNEQKPITSLDIVEAFEGKGWKKTTIATFLTRLVEKGALFAEKQGKLYYYTPLISQKDYRMSRTKNLISSLYGGSIKDFAVSLFEEQSISEEELKELKAFFVDKVV